MTNTKIIKSNKYSLTEMNPIQLKIGVLWHFCVVFRPYGNRLRWSLYRAGITPLRGLYACYMGNLCTLVIYGNIVCICTSYVGLTPSDWRPGGRGFNPRRGRQHSFVEIDHEIFSTVILSLPLIQEGQLSVSGEKMCTVLVNRLED